MIAFITNNTFLLNGLTLITFDTHNLKCKCKFIIIDINYSDMMFELKNIDIADICCIVFLVNNLKDTSLLKHIPFPCPVHYIPLSVPISVLTTEVNALLGSLKSKQNCYFKISDLSKNNWISRKEFQTLRLFYAGKNTSLISSMLNISSKTVSNYVRKTMTKLELNFSSDGVSLFNTFEKLIIYTSSLDINALGNDHCPLRVNYIKIKNKMHDL